MNYSFLPSEQVANDLRQYFRSRLKESYASLLDQLSEFSPRIFPRELVSGFENLDAIKYGGLHCFVYHHSITLAERSSFEEIARLMNVLVESRYHDLPRHIPSESLDKNLLREILDQIKIGTTHNKISLIPVSAAIEEDAGRIVDIGIEKLRSACPELAAENDALVGSIIYFESAGETSERALSFTGDRLQSLILINAEIERDWIFLLDKLVHEAAHTYLYAINLQEEMVRNSPDSIFSSPLRRDERTMLGIYHATFVIQRLILAFTRILENAGIEEHDRVKVGKLLAYYHSRLDTGFTTVMEHGDLSNTAKGLITEGQEYAKYLRSSTAVEFALT